MEAFVTGLTLFIGGSLLLLAAALTLAGWVLGARWLFRQMAREYLAGNFSKRR